jgi:2-polyprenyl-3-methyl-5-hydroxy-6-metoxy-1,4-benzoquinol methylase
MSNVVETMPSPDLFFETVFAFERTAALKTAIDLDVFTALAEGARTAPAIAAQCGAAERGIRILCNYLTTLGLLEKIDDAFGLTPVSAAFLSKRSRAYLGGALAFLASPDVVRNFDQLTETVRRGTIPPSANNTVSQENPAWVTFAEAMAPTMMPNAMAMAEILPTSGETRVLDLAAGHGMFGITLAQRNPRADIVAVDWPAVLAVAKSHAVKMGVGERYRTIAGDAFAVDFGSGFDIALVTNFLHHFDKETNVAFMRKVAAALKPGGRVAVLEFVPNDDAVSPPIPAQFGLIMLAGTPAGEVYSFRELKDMLQRAGFSSITPHSTPTPQTIVVAVKD